LSTTIHNLQIDQEVLEEIAVIIARMGEAQRVKDDLVAVEESAIASAKAATKKGSRKPNRVLRDGWRRLGEIDALYGNELFAQLQHLDAPTGEFGRQKTSEVTVTGRSESVARRLLRLGRRDLVREIYELEVDKVAAKKEENLPVVAATRGLRIDEFINLWIKPAGRRGRINAPKRKIGIRRKK